jgi:hypothetical protein
MADEEGWGSEEFILYSRQLLIQGVRAAGEVSAPIATFEEEFARLALNNGWKKRTPEYAEQWALAWEKEMEAQHGPRRKARVLAGTVSGSWCRSDSI